MSELRAFVDYVQAFEAAYLTDDWTVLEPFFANGARHVVRDGGPHDRDNRGRSAVIEGLRRGVLEHDRRFDLRLPEIVEGPLSREDGVWMRFRLTTCREGLPDLTIEGEHLTRYENGRIVALEERLLEDSGRRCEEYFRTHAATLREPSAGAPDLSGTARLDELQEATVRSLVRAYGAAKSEQNIEAALAICDESFTIDTVSFGIASRDRAETADHLALFFDTFPDYRVSVEGLMSDGDQACLWGRATMTLRGAGLGVTPTGRTADVPIFCVFGFAGARMTSERFFFDLNDLCRQLGVSVDEVSKNLEAFRAAAAA